jgi:hypothetical protein
MVLFFISLKEITKTTEDFSKNFQSSDRDSNPGPSRYEAAVLIIQPRRSVKMLTELVIRRTYY